MTSFRPVIEIMRIGPVIPVIVIDEVKDAVPLARALVAGGVRVLEVTLRTPAALEAIRAISAVVEEAIVGVGTITRSQDFEASLKAGAQFAVSPGLTPSLITASRDTELPFLPGTMTPSDIIAAREAGFTELKLFPALQAGGIGMLRALASPFSDVTFCPTGGISAQTAPDFLSLPNVACVGGSWLVPSEAVRARDWEKISKLARAAAVMQR